MRLENDHGRMIYCSRRENAELRRVGKIEEERVGLRETKGIHSPSCER